MARGAGFGSAPAVFLETPATEQNPSLSPNGRWLAYTSDESGQGEVYVRPFPGPGGRSQVSTDGGTNPVWAHDGGEIFYISTSGSFPLYVATVRTEPDFAVESRQQLFSWDVYFYALAHPEWDLSPDGKQLVLVGDDKEDRSLRVLDLAGNLVEEIVLNGLPGATLESIAWPAAGPGFYFDADSPRGDLLGFVEPTGDAHVWLQVQSESFDDLRPSPDGRRLAYRMNTTDSNVWMIDDF